MKKIIGLVLFFALLLGAGGLFSNWIDHGDFKTVKAGEIIVLSDRNFPVFVPKGAYFVGNLHQFIDGDLSNDHLSEGRLKTEYLVGCFAGEKAVVYWSSDQKAEAEKLLQ